MMRVKALQDLFEQIARERMRDVAICHPCLQVATVGFTRYQWTESTGRDSLGEISAIQGSFGVLVTPWCLNWVFLADDPLRHPAVGTVRVHQWGGDRYTFIGAYEDGFGGFEACSLLSPVLELADQTAAIALAESVMQEWHKVQIAAQLAVEAAMFAAAQKAEAERHINSGRRNFLRGHVREV